MHPQDHPNRAEHVQMIVFLTLALTSACQEIYIYLNPKNKWQFKIAKNFHVR